MRGSPTPQFLAEQLGVIAERADWALMVDRKHKKQWAKWLRCASRTLLLQDCEIRNQRAKATFFECLARDGAGKKGLNERAD